MTNAELERENARLRQALHDKTSLCTQLGELLEAHRRADPCQCTNAEWVGQIEQRQAVREEALMDKPTPSASARRMLNGPNAPKLKIDRSVLIPIV